MSDDPLVPNPVEWPQDRSPDVPSREPRRLRAVPTMTRLSRLTTTILALLLVLGGAASALVVNITDRDLQGRLGYGESSGKSITVQLSPEATGPVKIFLIDDRGAVTSYSGTVQGNSIILDDPPGVPLRSLLASRGLTLVIERASGGARSFSLPGLKADPKNNGNGNGNEKNVGSEKSNKR